MREGYRQFQMIEIMPLARLAEEELSLKLGTEIRLNFDALSLPSTLRRRAALSRGLSPEWADYGAGVDVGWAGDAVVASP